MAETKLLRFVRKTGQLALLLSVALLLSLDLALPAVAAHLPTSSESKHTVLLFVSTSMPPASLAALLRDAQAIDAPVLLQGLVDNTFRATFARIHDLVQQAGGGGISIDPVAFEKYGIDHVPAVVVVSRTENCVDTLSGDIPLVAALRWVQAHGDCGITLTPTIRLLEKGDTSHEQQR